MWLANLFATRRELKRLASDNHALRLRVSSLEEKNERLSNLLLERDFLWADRFLTDKGAYAIADEARHKSQPPEDITKLYKEQRSAYLEARRQEILADAREAGYTEADAERKFQELTPTFTEQFENGF